MRPEDVSLASTESGQRATFDAEVTVREPLGELLLLHCRVGDDELQVKVEPRSNIGVGDVIELTFDEERLHLFDETTGTALYHSATGDHEVRTAPPTE